LIDINVAAEASWLNSSVSAFSGANKWRHVMKLNSLIPVGHDRNAPARQTTPFGTLQREIERLFDDFGRGFPAFGSSELTPRMDVMETDKTIELTAELPGLEEKDVDINYADGVLTIRGEKKSEKEEKDNNYRLIERSYGSFSRAIELPSGVDPASVKASLTKGVLTVTVPKPAPSVTKKIEIKAAA
jgi:HSP20 family protein